MTPTQVTGDGQEYLQTAQAWFDHAAPDLRAAETPRVNRMILPHSYRVVDPRLGFFQARNGRWYCWHFWFYPLLGVPAKAILHALRADEYHAFKWTNLVLFLAAGYVTLCFSGLSPPKRWMLVGLCAVGPVLWYVNWVHTEAFTWSCVLVAVALVTRGCYWGAALSAAVGSMQNPPVAFFALYIILLSLRERNRHTTLATVIAATPCAIPPLFYLWHFGCANLIMQKGFSGLRYVSWSRLWSFFFDLNQGMLPYVPVLLILAALAWAAAIRRRQWGVAGIGPLLILMILGAAMTHDWISAMCGISRYAVWMLPLFAWLVVEGLPDTRELRYAVALAVVLQATVVLKCSNARDTLTLKWPARVVWNYAPAYYNPEYMIFMQRVTGGFGAADRVLPIGYVAPSGSVTKVLADRESLEKLPSKFAHVDGDWLRQIERQYAHVHGKFYLHPPPGAVSAR